MRDFLIFCRIFPTNPTCRTLFLLFVDCPLPAVVRLDDGGDGGADHQDGGQAAVGDPIVSYPVEPLSEHRAENTENLKNILPITITSRQVNIKFKPGLKHLADHLMCLQTQDR